jgi:hypothetical protein
MSIVNICTLIEIYTCDSNQKAIIIRQNIRLILIIVITNLVYCNTNALKINITN